MEKGSYGDTDGTPISVTGKQSKESSFQIPIGVSENGKPTDENESPIKSLSNLEKFLKSEIPEEPSAQFISDAAHEMIEKLNCKRKVDTLLLEQFKQAMDAQTAKIVEQMEQHMYNTYESLNCQVDEKLQELFSSVNKITHTEGELENFRESLRMLYQEMQNE